MTRYRMYLLRKIYWKCMWLATALLWILFFFVVGSWTGCASVPLEILEADEIQVELSPFAREQLKTYHKVYSDSLDLEFSFCVYGFEKDGFMLIQRFELPAQFQEWGSLSSYIDTCSVGFIAWGHSHPLGNDELSSTDKETFLRRKEKYTFLTYQHNGYIQLRLFDKYETTTRTHYVASH